MDTRRRRALIESFEPRIMYSADPGPAGLAAAVLTAAEVQVDGGEALQGVGTELVFIDARVPELQLLLDDLAAQQQAGRAVEVVVIGGDEDGIAVVGQNLAGRTDVAAIHLIGHGADGVAELGAGRLDAESLVLRASEIAAWGDALTADADLLIYGCDVAATPVGESLVDALAALTGADVAASDNLTGAAGLGGDWNLEYRSGAIEAAIAPGLQVQQTWDAVLAITANGTVTSANSLNTLSLTWSHTVASGTDRALFVEISIGTTGTIANSVTYGGTHLQLVGRSTGSGTVPVEIWRLLNPTVGTANVVVSLSANTPVAAGATTYNGVNQTNPVGTFYSAYGNSTNSSVTVADSAAGDLVIDAQSWKGQPSGGTVGPGQTLSWSQVNTSLTGGSTSEPGAPSVVMSGSFTSSAEWVIGAVAIHSAAPPAGITVTPISGLTVTEAGGTAQFSVVLDTAPTANVTIALTSSDTTEGTLSASSLTFTPANWNVAQTVTVTGVDDSFIDGNVAFTVVTAAASSIDGSYNGRNASDVSVTNSDNDTFNTLVVDTANDTLDGTTTSIAALMANKGGDGKISLREAITAANNTANGPGGADRISFAIGTGTQTIALASVLPTITDALIIDGRTQTGYSGTPLIVIDANGLAANGIQLGAGADGSTVRGLVLRDFTGNAIQIDAGSDGNTIAGNYIGSFGAAGLDLGSTETNLGAGVWVAGAGNTIGGVVAADRNVIGGNANGVVVSGAAASNNTIAGNYIGTDATGNAAAANTFDGVRIEAGATGNTVGGATSAHRNVISGNVWEGVQVDGEASDNNIIRGNWIGVNAAGTATLGNGGDGVFITAGADGTYVGGNTALEGNWIAAAGLVGIEVDGATSGMNIRYNRIGTDAAGTANWGTQQNGILLENSGGGAGPTSVYIAYNTVAFSGQGGVYTSGITLLNTAGASNSINGNSIYSNVGLGIDLGTSGVTANDAGDADTGANQLQNYPVLTLARTNGAGSLSINGALNSTANTSFLIEFFANPTLDAGGYGEGKTPLGSVVVTTDGSGNVSFSSNLAVTVAEGQYITATASRYSGGFTFETSEFSRGVYAISSTQASVVVDTVSDAVNANDGDTTSLSTLLANKGSDGLVSLREAIIAANNTANGAGGADRILFSIAGSGPHSIALASVLPTITEAVIIDGTSEPDFAGTPVIELNGASAGTVADATHGLVLGSGSSGSTIKGLAINRFAGSGIQIDSGSGGNLITGNYLGTDTTGLVDRGNGKWGIDFLFAGGNNVVGGTTTALRNVIAGNDMGGIALNGAAVTGNVVLGNYIGVGSDGTTAVGNGPNGGIVFFNGATARVGGVAAGEGNLIAYNSAAGINVTDGTASILGNSIFANGALGIDLAVAGVTANDLGDADTGPNNLQNYPEIGSAVSIGGNTTVTGTLRSNANTTYRLEFFSSASGDASGYGEGQTWLGSTSVTTDAAGNASFSATFSGIAVSAGYVVSATATVNLGGGSYGATSEFSASRSVNAGARLTAAQDTYINGSNPTLNYGASGSLVVDYSGGSIGDVRALLQFDLSSLPSAATIASATLQMMATGITGPATNLNVYQLTESWVEGSGNGTAGAANWTQRQSGTAWSTAGGSFNATIVASLSPSGTGLHSWDLTALVRSWVSGATTNNGLIIGSPDGGGQTITYDSSEGTTPPVLVISYSFAANNAPVLDAAKSPTLAATTEDAGAPSGAVGTLVSGLVDFAAPAGQVDNVTDADSGALTGIAVTATNTSSGSWWYSLNNGSDWLAMGSVSEASARLLSADAGTRLYFQPNANWNGSLADAITFRAWDRSNGSNGGLADATSTGGSTAFSSVSDTASLTVSAVNDAPVVTATGAAAAYTEKGSVAVDGGLTVFDADGGNLTTATVAITGGFASGQDRLGFTDQGSIRGSWNSQTGVLTLSGSASVADYQAALRSITYSNASDSPSTTSRTVSFTVSDGTASSNTATRAITIASTNDAPTFDAAEFYATLDIAGATERGQAVLVQPDGKILVAGYTGSSADFLLVRYNANGSLDTSFGGGDGIVTTSISAGDDKAHGLALQLDGKIIVVGETASNDKDFAVLRYNADGSLDTGFGGGDGIVTTDFAGGSLDVAYRVVIQADGRIVVGGASGSGTTDFAVARYLADGTLDTSFSGDGKQTVDLAGSVDEGFGLALDAAGRIVQAGSAVVGSQQDFAVVRYNTDGSLDASFSGDGKLTTDIGTSSADFARDVAVQADGSIVVGGSSFGVNNDLALVSYQSDGTLNAGFGTGGKVVTDLGSNESSWDLALQPDGRIVVVGGGGGNHLLVARYLADGSADTSFSGDGNLLLSRSSFEILYAVDIAPDGRIVAAGYGTNATEDLAVLRLGADGTVDTRLATGSSSLGSTLSYTENGLPVVIDSSVRIFDAELSAADNFNGATLSLARSGGASSEDIFAASGNLAALTEGQSLVLGGVTVGAVVTNSGGTLSLSFNGNATQARINEVMSSIAYANSSDTPPASVQLDWAFSDGNAGSQGGGGALGASGSSTVNITAVNDAPVITFVSGNANYPENAGPVIVAPAATVSDVDSADFNGGRLVVYFSANGQPEDRIAIRNQGTGAGLIGLSGSDVTYGGLVIGTWTGGTSGTTALIVSLNANATSESVQALGRNITYENVSDAPSTLVRTMMGYLEDGDGGTSNTVGGTLTIVPINDAPVATDDTATATEDQPYTSTTSLLANDSDVDGPALSVVAGTYATAQGGSITIGSDGHYTYTAAADFNGTDTVDYTLTDGSLTDVGTLTLTVTAVNDAPVVTITQPSYAATEQVALTLGGSGISISDVDAGSAVIHATLSVVSGTLSGDAGTTGVTLAGVGTGSMTLDGTVAQINAFLAGDSGASLSYLIDTDTPPPSDTLTLTVNDLGYTGGPAQSGSDTATIDITAVNDPAVIGGSTSASLTETDAAQSTGGTLTVSDVDSSATFVAQTNVAGSGGYGTFSLDASGSWTYTMGAAHDEFVAGQTYTDSFTAASADGTTQLVTVTITGTNDPAVIGGSTSASLTETDAAQSTGGTLTVSDVDSAATFVAQSNVAGSGGYGTFSLDTAGAWTYTMGAAHDEFVAGQTYTDSFTAASADGTTQLVTVTITGTNDPAVIGGSTSASLTETDAVQGTGGTLTVSDVDSAATFVVQSGVAGNNNYGTFSLDTAGAWTYTMGSAHDEFVAGQTYTDSFTAASADGTTQLVTVTITGTNDAAVIGGSASASLTETDAVQSANGSLTVSDVDSAATFVVQTNVAGSGGYGTFSLDASGSWTYTMGAAHDEFVAGQTYTDSFTAASADGTTQLVTVTITGTNDAAVIGGSTGASLTETDAAQGTGGTLTVSDVDSSATFVAQSGVAGNNHYGTFSLDTGGSWTYTMGGAHDEFVAGQTYTDSFTAASADGTTQLVTVTITGTNDAAVIGGSASASLTETDAAQSTGGTLTVSDVDSAATFVAQSGVAGNNHYGTFSLDTAGAWTYTMGSAHDEFVAGQTYTDSFTAASADGTTQLVTVTITGTNDAAVIGGSTSASLTETDAVQGTGGSLTVSDVDSAATFVAQSGVAGNNHYGTFSLDTGGSWTYTMGGAHDEFVAGQTYTDSFTAASADGTTQLVTVTITGTNDAAVIGGSASASLTETDAAQGTGGTLTVSDVDSAATFVVQSGVAGNNNYGTFSLDAGGAWTYTMGAAHDEFVAGQTYTDSFTAASADGTTQLVTVTITGTNDTPTLTSPIADQSATQDAAFSFTLPAGTFADVDAGDSLSYSVTGLPSWLSFNAATRSFSGTPANADVGSTTITVTVTDGSNATASDSFTLTVANTNDAPVALDDTVSTAEDTPLSFDPVANDIDVDGDVLSVASVTQAAHGGVSLVGGVVLYTPDANFHGADSFTYTVADGQGGFATATVSVTVTPVDDLPQAADDALVLAEDELLMGSVAGNDSPSGDGGNVWSVLEGPSHGSLVLAGDGGFRYTPDADFHGTDRFTYTLTDADGDSVTATATILVTPVNDAPVMVRGASVALNIAENTTVVTTLNATDVDQPAQALRYSIVGGADQALFAVDAASGLLRFTAPPDYDAPVDADGNNVYELIVQVSDGTATASQTLAITVDNRNEMPRGSDGRIGMAEDGSYRFTLADFGFRDDLDRAANSLAAVQIVALPGQGLLQLAGRGVVAGEWVAAGDIAAGRLSYQPAPDANGSDYATLLFRVRDDGGTAGGGIDTEAGTHTLSIDVAAVNDAPFLSRVAFALPAGTRVGLDAGAIVVSDVDSALANLQYIVDAASGGHFERAGAAGQAILAFTQAELAAGRVVFVHDMVQATPVVVLHASDGEADSNAVTASITLQVSAPGGPTGPVDITQEPPVSPVTPVLTKPVEVDKTTKMPATVNRPGLVDGPAQAIKPASPGDGGVTPSPDGSGHVDPSSRTHRQAVGGTLRFDRAPVRLSLGDGLDGPLLDFMLRGDGLASSISSTSASLRVTESTLREGLQGKDGEVDVRVVLQAIELTGVALSVGAVWWATRAGALVASLLVSVPAWRNFDPLMVLGPEDEDDRDWAGAMDDRAVQDEMGIADVFDAKSGELHS